MKIIKSEGGSYYIQGARAGEHLTYKAGMKILINGDSVGDLLSKDILGDDKHFIFDTTTIGKRDITILEFKNFNELIEKNPEYFI